MSDERRSGRERRSETNSPRSEMGPNRRSGEDRRKTRCGGCNKQPPGHYLWCEDYEPPADAVMDIEVCPRCGGRHEGIVFTDFDRPPVFLGVKLERWAMCPDAQAPILQREAMKEDAPKIVCEECRITGGFHRDDCSHRHDLNRFPGVEYPDEQARGSLGEVLRPGPR